MTKPLFEVEKEKRFRESPVGARAALFITLFFLRQYLVGVVNEFIFECHERDLVKIYSRVFGALARFFKGQLYWPKAEEIEEQINTEPSDPLMEGIFCAVDGTMINTHRSTIKFKRGQKDPYYSGHKHKTGLNMLCFVYLDGRVMFPSRTVPGGQPDQAIWNEQHFRDYFTQIDYGLLGDAGFTFNVDEESEENPHILGITPQPKRNLPRGSRLGDEDRETNKVISKHRVIVENVFMRLKQWRFMGGLNRHFKALWKKEGGQKRQTYDRSCR